MSQIAFELRSDAADFSGGSVSLPDGSAFDVGEALKSGSGKIALSPAPRKGKEDDAAEIQRAREDSQKFEALQQHPALKLAADAPSSSGADKKGSDS